MTAVSLPQHEGQFTPAEALAWRQANTLTDNLAGDPELAANALRYTQDVHSEWTERVRPLHRRWKGTYHMLAGNTLERGGPADIHVPEIYKAVETMVPRLEEIVLEHDPWFRVVPRKKRDERQADAISALLEWQFQQAKVRSMVQPALRNMLITQCAPFHVYWDDRKSMRNVREIKREFDKDGRLKRSVKVEMKEVIDYSGPVAELVDPFDFIIDTKATDPQKALYVGHRSWMTIDQVRRLGEQEGWKNLDKLNEKASNNSSTFFNSESDYYRWPRDPTSRYGILDHNAKFKQDERPETLEVVTIYTKWSLDGGLSHEDYRMIVVGGRVCVDLRKNPIDGGMRPYATWRVTKSGHEFYSIGPFDNAVRINQHLDRYHQISLRAAEVAACPMVFAEEDSDLPDSLYKVRPFSVFKGVGAVRFTQVPSGSLSAMPMIIGMLQKSLEETVGNFRINMGQDTGGTATEASLSLQEGNRRNRGHVRAVADGLDQLLHLFYRLTLQYSTDDVEFPVLGKRALDLRRTHMNVGPADLLDDVLFELVGLKSSRTYGERRTGLMAIANAMTPFIVGAGTNFDQLYFLHSFIDDVLGTEEADRMVRIPTPLEKLKSQDEENEALVAGESIEVDPDDDDEAHMQSIVDAGLYDRAMDKSSGMPFHVRKVVLEHFFNHDLQRKRKKAQEKAAESRMPTTADVPVEAGGMPQAPGQTAPPAGGMSNALSSIGQDDTDGQMPGQNPGPTDAAKYGKGSRKKRTVNQTEDRV